MRWNLLFGMFVVAVFALRLWAQSGGEVGWSDDAMGIMTLNQELAGFIGNTILWGLVLGAVRVAQTNHRAKQQFATEVLGL